MTKHTVIAGVHEYFDTLEIWHEKNGTLYER
jgi:hypothetical protein